MKTVKFDEITGILRQLRLSVLHGLRDPATRDEALELKRQLDDAIGCLELCERHQIRPDANVVTVPEPQTRSPSSEFRLVEDHQSDRREVWTEIMFDGEPVRPLPGSLIIERG
jgi:hypothetical protein